MLFTREPNTATRWPASAKNGATLMPLESWATKDGILRDEDRDNLVETTYSRMKDHRQGRTGAL